MASGLSGQLIPWIENAEKFTSNSLDKPRDFTQAQETEKKCTSFAKVFLSGTVILVDILKCFDKGCKISKQNVSAN